MERSLNSRCDFKNGFFTCNLPEDAVLLVVKVKTKTGNHTLVEDTEKQTEKFRPWKKPTKDGKTSPRKLPGVLTPRKNDSSMTSDSEPCPDNDTDNDIIDITDYSERPSNDRSSPQHKQKYMTPTVTQGHCPTPQNSPTYLAMNAVAATPAKPHQTEIWEILLEKKRVPCRWPTCLRRQPPRVAFKNNDIYMINDGESDTYEELKERNLRVMYKLKVSKDPVSMNMPHEEEFDDNNYESIKEKETAV